MQTRETMKLSTLLKASKEMTLRVSDLLPNHTKQETGTQIFVNLLVFTF